MSLRQKKKAKGEKPVLNAKLYRRALKVNARTYGRLYSSSLWSLSDNELKEYILLQGGR